MNVLFALASVPGKGDYAGLRPDNAVQGAARLLRPYAAAARAKYAPSSRSILS